MMQTGSAMQTSIDDLTERIEIRYAERHRDAAGNLIPGEPQSRGTCWAKVLPLAAAVGDGVEAKANIVRYRVTIRYRDDLWPNDWLVWRGKVLTITSPPYDAESRRKWLVLDCQEAIADAGTA